MLPPITTMFGNIRKHNRMNRLQVTHFPPCLCTCIRLSYALDPAQLVRGRSHLIVPMIWVIHWSMLGKEGHSASCCAVRCRRSLAHQRETCETCEACETCEENWESAWKSWWQWMKVIESLQRVYFASWGPAPFSYAWLPSAWPDTLQHRSALTNSKAGRQSNWPCEAISQRSISHPLARLLNLSET